MPVPFLVRRAFTLGPVVRLGWGAFSAHSFGDDRRLGSPQAAVDPVGTAVPVPTPPPDAFSPRSRSTDGEEADPLLRVIVRCAPTQQTTIITSPRQASRGPSHPGSFYPTSWQHKTYSSLHDRRWVVPKGSSWGGVNFTPSLQRCFCGDSRDFLQCQYLRRQNSLVQLIVIPAYNDTNILRLVVQLGNRRIAFSHSAMRYSSVLRSIRIASGFVASMYAAPRRFNGGNAFARSRC